MISLKSSLNLVGWIADDDKARASHLKDALEATGEEWHDKYLPLHFKRGAGQRYGYEARKKLENPPPPGKQSGIAISRNLSPNAWKAPLVWTGLTKRQAQRAPWTTSTSKRVKVKMNVPNYTKYGHHGRSRYYMHREMTSVTREELQHLASFAADRLTDRMNRSNSRRTVRS